jgi:hypothetical protein
MSAGDDAPLHLPDACRKIVDLHDHRGERLAGDLWNARRLVLKRCHELWQTLDALWPDDSEFRHVSAQAIDQHRALAH